MLSVTVNQRCECISHLFWLRESSSKSQTCSNRMKHSLVHIVTDVYILHFIHNALRDTESDTIIQMTLRHVLVLRFKKKEMDEKNNFL